MYGAGVWDVSKANRKKILITNGQHLKISCWIAGTERSRCKIIETNIDIKEDIINEIKRNRQKDMLCQKKETKKKPEDWRG